MIDIGSDLIDVYFSDHQPRCISAYSLNIERLCSAVVGALDVGGSTILGSDYVSETRSLDRMELQRLLERSVPYGDQEGTDAWIAATDARLAFKGLNGEIGLDLVVKELLSSSKNNSILVLRMGDSNFTYIYTREELAQTVLARISASLLRAEVRHRRYEELNLLQLKRLRSR